MVELFQSYPIALRAKRDGEPSQALFLTRWGRNDQINLYYVTYGLIETGEVTVGSIRKIDLSEVGMKEEVGMKSLEQLNRRLSPARKQTQ